MQCADRGTQALARGACRACAPSARSPRRCVPAATCCRSCWIRSVLAELACCSLEISIEFAASVVFTTSRHTRPPLSNPSSRSTNGVRPACLPCSVPGRPDWPPARARSSRAACPPSCTWRGEPPVLIVRPGRPGPGGPTGLTGRTGLAGSTGLAGRSVRGRRAGLAGAHWAPAPAPSDGGRPPAVAHVGSRPVRWPPVS